MRSKGIALVLGISLTLAIMLGGLRAASAAESIPQGQPVTVTGVNYCFGCDLKKAHQAHAQCDLFGHKHSLRVISMKDGSGKAITGHNDKALHYLPNQKSDLLWSGDEYHGKKVTIRGRLYSDDRVLEVESFEVAAGGKAR